MENQLAQAIELIKAGKKSEGGRILAGLVKTDPDNELAWQWLSACVAPDEQKRHCLMQVLRINPQNETAKNMLASLDFNPVFEVQQPNVKKDDASSNKNQTEKSKNKNPFLLPTLIVLVAGLFLFYLVLKITSAPDANECVQIDSCMLSHRSGDTVMFGEVKNICDKPIEKISLRGRVVSSLDNSILASEKTMQRFELTPGKVHLYEVVIENSYFGELLYCEADIPSAYYVKNSE